MIEKLLEGFEIAPVNSTLALEKCLHHPLIKVCDCEVVSSQPLPKIRKKLQFQLHCLICVALLYQRGSESPKLGH
jgi:hypothetical protein